MNFDRILPEKKLYSPGPIPQSFQVDITFSHRSQEFQALYADTKRKLRERFDIPDRYKILFTQGSGTSAIETVLSSIPRLEPVVQTEGTFSERAYKIAHRYFNSIQPRAGIGEYFYYTQFETSQSKYYEITEEHPGKLTIVDCISGFGFYPLPDAANICILSSSKILGGLPALGIILYDEEAEAQFWSRGDYLNIQNYIEYDKRNQTPHTSLLPQFLSLNKALDDVISREQILQNCFVLYSDQIEFRGQKICPVVTIMVKDPEEWVQKFQKFNIEVYWNPVYMTDSFQVSMFNYRDPIYYDLIQAILLGELK